MTLSTATPETNLIVNPVEHTVAFLRETGGITQEVNFALMHSDLPLIPVTVATFKNDDLTSTPQFASELIGGEAHELILAVLTLNPDEQEVIEQITLSYAEAKVLKSFLNREDVTAILEQQP